ncbi:unnamed protein product, partial [Staurois parvus]
MMSGNDILLTTIHVIVDWPISDHWILASDCTPAPGDCRVLPMGGWGGCRELYVNNTVLSPISSSTLLC